MFIMFEKIMNYFPGKDEGRLGMAADDNAHDFEVQHEEPDHLPGKKFAPEPGGTGGIGGIVNAFGAGGYGFCLHFADF